MNADNCGCCTHDANAIREHFGAADDRLAGSQNEIIYISLGQAGVQMSHAAWELFCLEHGICVDGTRMANFTEEESRHQDVFFYESSTQRRVPRSVLADLEPSVVDEIRLGAYKALHHPECLVTGMEDAANNFARGHFTIGKMIIPPTLTQIRRQAERCESLQGFMVTCGLGGGTGSGFTAVVLERLSTEFAKKSKVMVNIFPGPTMSNAVVEAYNVTLAMHTSIEFTDVNITLDNEAVYKVCQQKLHYPQPTYNHINRLMAQVMSAMTCSLRFPSALNSDLCQLQTNLVPFPRIHFPLVGYAPICTVKSLDRSKFTPMQAVTDLFEPLSQLVSCDTSKGKFMACNLQFRGMVSPREMSDAICHIKKNEKLKFVDWCPTGFKVGICTQPPVTVPGSEMGICHMNCTMMANSSAVGQVWEKLQKNFSLLFAKRAFVHWYVGEGMEEGEFNEALDDVKDLVNDYNTVTQNTEEEEEEDIGNVDTDHTDNDKKPSSLSEQGAAQDEEPKPEGGDDNPPSPSAEYGGEAEAPPEEYDFGGADTGENFQPAESAQDVLEGQDDLQVPGGEEPQEGQEEEGLSSPPAEDMPEPEPVGAESDLDGEPKPLEDAPQPVDDEAGNEGADGNDKIESEENLEEE